MEPISITSTRVTGGLCSWLHGLVGSSKNWNRNISFLAQDASVYAVDLFNMGQSDRVPGLDAGLAATADRLAASMDALGLDQADIAAHSHGGAVAMMFAARHPAVFADSCSSLQLIRTATWASRLFVSTRRASGNG